MWFGQRTNRRQQRVRRQLEKDAGSRRTRLLARLFSWRVIAGTFFVIAAGGITLLAEGSLEYSLGQRISNPIFARVDFEVPDLESTAANKEAARASTPSYYSLNAPALVFERIRADLMGLYQAAVAADTFEAYQETLKETGWPVEKKAYRRLRALGDETGQVQYQRAVAALPLEREYIVGDLLGEQRTPKSTTGFIRLEISEQGKDKVRAVDIPHAQLTPQGNERALKASARELARHLLFTDLTSTAEAIILATLREQPTIVYNRDRTLEEMRKAEEATPLAMTSYHKGSIFISPGVLGLSEYQLLKAERTAFHDYLKLSTPDAVAARRSYYLQQLGKVVLVALLSVGLLVYTAQHQPRIFENRARTVAYISLMLGCLLTARMLEKTWPQVPELVYFPCLFAVGVLSIVYPRRLAVGIMCIMAVLVTTTVHASVSLLLVLFTGIAVAGHELVEIRSRTKLISTGFITALAMMITSLASSLMQGHDQSFLLARALWSGGSAMAATFVLSGVLPFIERMFRIATSLTLLEWRDPTRPLLQLLAREAPGTYNHSLMVGTLVESACEAIGANGLLTQVGAIYHDIGKIPKADYFAENQVGHISRHENLAPTMSLLIILGHVKDGIEMAKEYKLPRVLHQFIEEHHGTTVVRYFHHVASEKQPKIASGKHDREVSEADFRYGGPKPRTRETAVLMLADGVEGAVRALPEPTAGRIENVVHQVVTDRLNDGQFDDCDITLKELRLAEESLVKSLCGIYHGRVAYPKAQTEAVKEERPVQHVGAS